MIREMHKKLFTILLMISLCAAEEDAPALSKVVIKKQRNCMYRYLDNILSRKSAKFVSDMTRPILIWLRGPVMVSTPRSSASSKATPRDSSTATFV